MSSIRRCPPASRQATHRRICASLPSTMRLASASACSSLPISAAYWAGFTLPASVTAAMASARFRLALGRGTHVRLDVGGAQQLLVDARDALHLALGREALVRAI